LWVRELLKVADERITERRTEKKRITERRTEKKGLLNKGLKKDY
jgi:hypothetical protein